MPKKNKVKKGGDLPKTDFRGQPVRLVKGKDIWGYQIATDDEPQPGQTALIETEKGKKFVVEIEEVVSVREWNEHLIWKVRAKDDREFDYSGPTFAKIGVRTRTNKDGEEVEYNLWGVRIRKGEAETGDSVEVEREDGSHETVFLLDQVKAVGKNLVVFEMETERQRRIRKFNERKIADDNADALDFE